MDNAPRSESEVDPRLMVSISRLGPIDVPEADSYARKRDPYAGSQIGLPKVINSMANTSVVQRQSLYIWNAAIRRRDFMSSIRHRKVCRSTVLPFLWCWGWKLCLLGRPKKIVLLMVISKRTIYNLGCGLDKYALRLH